MLSLLLFCSRFNLAGTDVCVVNMFKVIISLAIFVAVSYGAPDSRVYCGVTPNNIFRCLNNPATVSTEVPAKCAKYTTQCEKMTCMFRESNWLDGTVVNKQKLSAYFDKYAKDHPEWSPAIQKIKEECLDPALPAQGVFLNCPAYDVMQCTVASFLRYATPAQWSTSEECAYTRAYAAACPVCPEDCFAQAIPIGSCNACTRLPSRPQTP